MAPGTGIPPPSAESVDIVPSGWSLWAGTVGTVSNQWDPGVRPGSASGQGTPAGPQFDQPWQSGWQHQTPAGSAQDWSRPGTGSQSAQGSHWGGPDDLGSGAPHGGGPTDPLGPQRDPNRPMLQPERPKTSKAPLLVIGGVIVLALLALTIGAVNTWRSDQATKNASATPRPEHTGSTLPPNVRPFTTDRCSDGLFEVLNHQRRGTELFIEVRISCNKGRFEVDEDIVAIFDKFSEAYRNDPPTDRDALGTASARPGSPVQGWTQFHSVPAGEATVLLLGYGRTVTAVPITS